MILTKAIIGISLEFRNFYKFKLLDLQGIYIAIELGIKIVFLFQLINQGC